MRELPTDEYKFCNHHHEIGENHEVVNFGDDIFVANKAAIPLLRALNEVGLRTRTHHYDGGNNGFISVLLEDGVKVETRRAEEREASRTKHNGKTELLIQWHNGDS